MNKPQFHLAPIAGAGFGKTLEFEGECALTDVLRNLEAQPDLLSHVLAEADGLLVFKQLGDITDDPELLVRLSRLFGPEVENYHETAIPKRWIHPQAGEIFVLSNLAPLNFNVPDRPQPPLTEDGKLPVQFPHRKGWHTDQSFRRPPPDISLFYAMQPCPQGQGQTLFANGYAAYDALSADMKERLRGLEAIHAQPWTGRGEDAVRNGEIPKPLAAHQQSQRQPIVRQHPVTGRSALYMCEESQLDWVLGPVAGMAPGPDNEGGRLVYELMTHYTQPEFTYVHEWETGDLIAYDNRNLVHSATWFDSQQYGRIMWRTTVSGNPGKVYAGESRSWIPKS